MVPLLWKYSMPRGALAGQWLRPNQVASGMISQCKRGRSKIAPAAAYESIIGG
jgi:hypothetical protein